MLTTGRKGWPRRWAKARRLAWEGRAKGEPSEANRLRLAARNATLEAVASASPLTTIGFDRNGVVTTWNSAAESTLGWTAHEAIGGLPPFIDRESLGAFRALLERALSGELVTGVEVERRRKDGSKIRLRVAVSAFEDANGEVGFVAVAEDITASGLAGRELDRIFAVTTDLVCVLGMDGYLKRVNPAFERFVGATEARLLTTLLESLVHPDDHEAAHRQLARLMNGMSPDVLLEFRMLSADGTYHDLSWNGLAVPDEGVVFAIGRDVSDRRQLERRLVVSESEAARANSAKSEFLSRMSHELRTPLNAILGFAQLLELDTSDEPGAVESVAHILKAGRHLLALIDQVLDISKIETGHLSLSPEPTAAEPVIADAVALMAPLAVERAVSLARSNQDAVPAYVIADASRLRQILFNLLSNAIKFSPTGGTVVIGGERTRAGHIRISVHDDGPGIAAELRERLFSPFDRLGDDDPAHTGTGLGLALSHGLAAAMGGLLGVDSAPGKGATFWIDLDPAEGPVEVTSKWAPAGATSAPAGEGAATPTATILLIEDNIDSLRLIERVVVEHFPDVRLLSAMQGRLGIELARTFAPRIVLLDMHLPDIDGREVLHRLHGEATTAQATIIFVSADASPGLREQLIAEGAVEFLTKPIDVPAFIALIERLIVEEPPG